MATLQTREARLIVALGKLTKRSGTERNFKTDEMEPYVVLRGELADITKALITALDSA